MSTNHPDTRMVGEPAGEAEEVAASPLEPSTAEGEPGLEAEEPSRSADESGVVPPSAGAPSEGLLRELAVKIEILTESIEEANRLSGERERIIDRLHQENQQLRQGELQQAVLPIFRDLVRLYDDLRQTAGGYGSRDGVTQAEVARDFELFAEMVADILYRQGVERYEAREGDTFSTKEHRVLSAVQTPEQAKDRTIARSVRDGFRSDARVIRLLEAEVYRYVPQAAPAADDGGAKDGAGPTGKPAGAHQEISVEGK